MLYLQKQVYLLVSMKINRHKNYAVLTGDIINSSKFRESERKELFRVMQNAAVDCQNYFSTSIPLPVDIYRGDSWQMVLSDLVMSLRIAMCYRLLVRIKMQTESLVDTRISIGIGKIDFIPSQRISQGDGDAFKRSGAAIEKLGRMRRMIIDIPDNEDQIQKSLNIVLLFIDFILQNTTKKQSQAILGALLGKTQEQIADSWLERTITQQAVAQHLDRAGWHAIEKGLNYFEETLMVWIDGKTS
jgi:hypothetical protein